MPVPSWVSWGWDVRARSALGTTGARGVCTFRGRVQAGLAGGQGGSRPRMALGQLRPLLASPAVARNALGAVAKGDPVLVDGHRLRAAQRVSKLCLRAGCGWIEGCSDEAPPQQTGRRSLSAPAPNAPPTCSLFLSTWLTAPIRSWGGGGRSEKGGATSTAGACSASQSGHYPPSPHTQSIAPSPNLVHVDDVHRDGGRVAHVGVRQRRPH
jgi:hypothetical protein